MLINCSEGLEVTHNLDNDSTLSSVAEIPLPSVKPFDSVTLTLHVLAKLPPQREKDPADINHKVVLLKSQMIYIYVGKIIIN